MMTDTCPNCSGNIERGTCVCAMSAQIRELLKKKFKLTDEELDEAFDEGRLYVSKCGRTLLNDDDITIEVIPCHVERLEI